MSSSFPSLSLIRIFFFFPTLSSIILLSILYWSSSTKENTIPFHYNTIAFKSHFTWRSHLCLHEFCCYRSSVTCSFSFPYQNKHSLPNLEIFSHIQPIIRQGELHFVPASYNFLENLIACGELIKNVLKVLPKTI